tara:strand:- start:253 stop:2406 length:2154 start_codon:yes stop_codon:yes gene_type:complete
MKYIYYFFLFSSLLFSQNIITLEDAVLNRWNFYPEKVQNIQWNNESDFFSLNNDTVIKIFYLNKSKKDKFKKSIEIKLDVLNESLRKIPLFNLEDTLTSFSKIDWLNKDTFKFEHKNSIYHVNVESELYCISVLEFPENATNKDYNFQKNTLAYTIDNNLYIADADNIKLKINPDKNEKNIIYGQAVHRYEFGIYKGTFWSPNGAKMAFYRKDESKVDDYPIISLLDSTTISSNIKYPMSSDLSHFVEIGIFDIDKKNIIYLDSGKYKDHYLTNICWGPSGEYIYVALLNRDQNHLKLNKYDSNTGKFIKTLFTEKDDKYVQPLHPMIFINEDQFLWRSEKDGYDHFYLYNKNGKLTKKLNSGNIVINNFLGFKNDYIYFSAYSSDGLDVHLYSYSIKEDVQKNITKKLPGYHSFKMSPSGKFFIDEFSNLKNPGIQQILDNQGNEIEKIYESNNPLENFDESDIELFQLITDDGTILNCRLVKPFNFDVNKKYAALIYVYNGPMVQLINNSWRANTPMWMDYLANQDFVIFTIDGRGSENRGKEFEQIIFNELGKIEMKDQLLGYDYLSSLDYVDKNKIAVYGWSYGGFMATNLLLNNPGLFSCGVAGGPVTDWSFYEIMYTERYMDDVFKNKEGYYNTSLLNKVDNLSDPLLMIHGLEDDVVVLHHSLSFIKECINKNKKIDYFIYPGHAHNVYGKDRLHLMSKVIDFLIDKTVK